MLLPLLAGSVIGSVLVGVAGYWNLRGLLEVLPMSLLKAVRWRDARLSSAVRLAPWMLLHSA